MMPNRKTDMNNNFAVSSDYIGANYDYANADDAHAGQDPAGPRDLPAGVHVALANHPRVSVADSARDSPLGLCQ